ncbi:Vacuolar protein sorting-associated protein 75 [Spathaspora sp. JA1]|nr:Vacuolar protein sorting-associated protein 75 [Spathaspora sp. JA1]
MSELSNEELSQKLTQLSKWEDNMSQTEKQLEIERLKTVSPLYEQRRDILKEIPQFWYIVIAENDDFVEYISLEDMKYLEYIDDIYVYYDTTNEDKKFSITFSFAENELIPKQTVTKQFKTTLVDGEERITSEPVDILWPHELEEINPQSIKQKNKGKQLSSQEKKNYRLGMRSFFSWFQWTGEKPGKEFRNGEDLTNFIVDDLYINALKYYIIALSNEPEDDYDEQEEDSSEGEELDLSEESDGDDRKKRSGEDLERDVKKLK